MGNRFTLDQAFQQAHKILIDGYEVPNVQRSTVEGKQLIICDMEEVGQPSRTYDGARVVELSLGEADVEDAEGNTQRIEFYETVPLSNNLDPVPE
jgi:hypothetical protein